MAAGDEAEALAGIADRLCAEFGFPVGEKAPAGAPTSSADPRHHLFGASLSPDQERMVRLARQNLDRFASALGVERPKMVSESTYNALLDGAETALRSELASGVPVAKVMPSLVFLVALPMVSREEALQLSRRTEALLGETQGPG